MQAGPPAEAPELEGVGVPEGLTASTPNASVPAAAAAADPSCASEPKDSATTHSKDAAAAQPAEVPGDAALASPNKPRKKPSRELKYIQIDAVWQADLLDPTAGRTRRSSSAAGCNGPQQQQQQQQQPPQTAPRPPKRSRTSAGGAAEGGVKRRKSAPGGSASAAASGSSAGGAEADASAVAASGTTPATDAPAADSPAGATSPETKQHKGAKKQQKPRAVKKKSTAPTAPTGTDTARHYADSPGDVQMEDAPSVSNVAVRAERAASGGDTGAVQEASSGKAAVKPKSKSRGRTSRAASEAGGGSADATPAAGLGASNGPTAAADDNAEAAGLSAPAAATQAGATAEGSEPINVPKQQEEPQTAANTKTAGALSEQAAAAQAPQAELPSAASPAAASAADSTAVSSLPAAEGGLAGDQAAAPVATTPGVATAAADESKGVAEQQPAAAPAEATVEVKAESAKLEPLAAGVAGPASGHDWQTKAQELAEKVKEALRDVPTPSGNYKIASILRCGVLTGEEVQYRRAAGGGAQQLLRGVIASDGMITCFCDRCKGVARQPNSLFEEHAGSKVRRPAQFTYLVRYNLSLKELGTLVNSSYMDSHISYCVQCRDGGDLMCCDGCPAAYHPACLGLETVLDGAWYCPACVQAGREPAGYRESEVFKQCQKGMENLRQQMTKARQAGGAGLAGLPPVAPPGYNKLGSSVGILAPSSSSPSAAGGSGGAATLLRSSARASARNAAAALAAAATEAEADEGLSGDGDDDSSGSGRGRGRGRGRGKGSGGYSNGSGIGVGRGRGRGRGRMRISSLPGVIGLDELDSLEGFVDPGRVRMACPQRMGGSGARRERNNNKHKRLFTGEPGALADGQNLYYKTGADGVLLRSGNAVIIPNGVSGIRCDCCGHVVSCSQFEAHAGRGARRAPYDFIFTEEGLSLRRLAERLPPLEGEAPSGAPLVARKGVDYARRAANRRAIWGDYEEEEEPEEFTGPPEVVHDTDGLGSGCVLCHEPDFLRGAFGDRTIMICDTCEREFHVGCLRDYGRADLKELPEGDWFCSGECSHIKVQLGALVRAGEMPLGPGGVHSWHVLRGFKHSAGRVEMSMRASMSILQGSFDPIMDANNNMDLLPLIIQAKAYREWDFSNMLTVLLRFNGRAVAAAVVRVFGTQLAELPLVATRPDARRLGHARVLVRAIEATLIELGVQALALPAAESARNTWIHGFGFSDMSEEQQAHVKRDLRMLIFPGTSLLVKSLYKDTDAAAPTAAAAAVADVTDPAAVNGNDAVATATAAAANPGLAAASDAGVLAASQATVDAAARAAAEAAVTAPTGVAGSISTGVPAVGQLPLHYTPNGALPQQQLLGMQPGMGLSGVGACVTVPPPQLLLQQQQLQQQVSTATAVDLNNARAVSAGLLSGAAAVQPGPSAVQQLQPLQQQSQQQLAVSVIPAAAMSQQQVPAGTLQQLQLQSMQQHGSLLVSSVLLPPSGINGPLSAAHILPPGTSGLGITLGLPPMTQQQAGLQQHQQLVPLQAGAAAVSCVSAGGPLAPATTPTAQQQQAQQQPMLATCQQLQQAAAAAAAAGVNGVARRGSSVSGSEGGLLVDIPAAPAASAGLL